MSFQKTDRITPAQIILLGFLLMILTGALLLTLPVATRGPGGAPFSDALFTAASAACVTGLVVRDTALYWAPFGQAVILLLIQVGGMGVVTMAVAIAMFAGKKISLRQRWVMQESISAPQVGGIVRMTGFILKTTFLLESLGAVALALRFCPRLGLWRGLWYAVFHAVSAFCNAGFDLMGVDAPFSSLAASAADPLVNFTVMALIVLGGLGFFSWQDVWTNRLHVGRYCLQTKLVLTVTAALLVLGGLFFYAYEFRLPQWAALTGGERALAAAFQSVSPRTAGFNTVDLTALSETGRAATILLMLVGGSPGSTAGGFKTTTLAVLILSVRCIFRRQETQAFGRRVPEDTVRSAAAILTLYLGLFLLGGALISGLDGAPLSAALFETASAIGTVGLTLGITPALSLPSRLILIFLMYFGRVGGLTMIYAAADRIPAPSQLPQGRVTVG